MSLRQIVVPLVCLIGLSLTLGGCSTAPKAENQADFLARAKSTTEWFDTSVKGLPEQIKGSAGYIVFPDVARWGIIFGGGTQGRGALYRPDGTQVGWAALNNVSVGLQAGVEGFRMLMVIENQATLDKFMTNQLTGSIAGVAVAGDAGASTTARFQNGVAIYQGANRGLMAGMNIGLDYVRYKAMADEAAGK